jgi:hypothetical protein
MLDLMLFHDKIKFRVDQATLKLLGMKALYNIFQTDCLSPHQPSIYMHDCGYHTVRIAFRVIYYTDLKGKVS